MKRSGSMVLIAFLVLPIAGAVAGRLAAPELARFNYIVNLAEHVRQDELNPPAEPADAGAAAARPATDHERAVKAFKTTGMPAAALYTQAREIREQFATGSVWFGLWCGLAAAFSMASTLRLRRRREYETDTAQCLACARCYRACPVERERLAHELGEQPL